MGRRNPKKDKTARRRRPGIGKPRPASFELDHVLRLMAAAPPDALPLVGVTSLWLWNLAQDGQAAAHCVEACVTLHHALAEFGIQSRIEAVSIVVGDLRADTSVRYGHNPHYNSDGTFNGHTVLIVTGADRLIDPTIQQFAEIPVSPQTMLPLQIPLPEPDSLGPDPIPVPRGDHYGVVYSRLPEHQRQAWRSSRLEDREADFRRAGENLAANTLAVLQVEDVRPRALRAPYPRLRTLMEATHGMKPVADVDGFRFADRTGRELHISEIA
jgi:hypothetical protein